MNAHAKVHGRRANAAAPEQARDRADDAVIKRYPRAGITAAFGLWGKDGLDGLAYQDWVRGE